MTRNPQYPAREAQPQIEGYHSIAHGAKLFRAWLASPEHSDDEEITLMDWLLWRDRQSKTKASEARARGEALFHAELSQ